MASWSDQNLRNAILRAISIAVDPLSEKKVRDAQPAQETKAIQVSSILLHYMTFEVTKALESTRILTCHKGS